MRENGVMFQYFEWYMDTQNDLWNRLKKDAKHLKEIGVTSIWIPPCFKATSGYDTGYGVYDLYDLGEFDQKGGVKTKYGSKDELLECIEELHNNGIQVYADVVLNHKANGDEKEKISVIKVDENNRLHNLSEPYDIEAWTKFTFPGRKDKYSNFKWNFNLFTATDYDALHNESGVFLIVGENKKFSENVDSEKGNFDYLMFNDVDVNHPIVKEELKSWSEWFIKMTKVDGFRFDALKHIDALFIKEFTENIKSKYKDFYCVGEYWNRDLFSLESYMNIENYTMDLFDVPLHFNFFEASKRGRDYDMRTIFNGSVVQKNKEIAVTFVDNHDSQPYQALESFVDAWFKPLAYSLILLRKDGYPCVFYGDYYSIKGENPIDGNQELLDKLLYIRSNHSYGEQTDYFDHGNVIGWVRSGNEEHPYGCAVVMSNGDEGFKEMYMGEKYKGKVFADYLGNRADKIEVNEEGMASFPCNAGSVSVWIQDEVTPEEAYIKKE